MTIEEGDLVRGDWGPNTYRVIGINTTYFDLTLLWLHGEEGYITKTILGVTLVKKAA